MAEKLRILYFPVLLLWLFNVQAQGQSKWVTRGETEFDNKQYRRAVEIFEYAAKKDSSTLALEGAAKSHRALKDYKRAEQWYALVVRRPDAGLNSYFYFGQALMNNGKYDVAQVWFRKFAAGLPDDSRSARFQDLENLIPFLMRDSSNYEITSLPFNSIASDFSSLPYLNGLIFCSSRKNEISLVKTSAIDGAHPVDLFFIEQVDTGQWKKAVPLSGAINSPFNEGPMTFSPEGDVMYFTRNVLTRRKFINKKGEMNKLSIIRAEWNEEKKEWHNFTQLPFNDPKHAFGHPAMSPDGTLLFFASDRPGGMGGTDIWQTEFKNGDWTEPINLGPDINTEGDEMFPFVHDDGTLFFASDGHLGLGGLDIFSSRYVQGKWSRVINQGSPINTSGDDFGFFISPDSKTGYLSSNRNTDGTEDDIFAFRVLVPEFDCVPQKKNVYCFKFFDEGTMDTDGTNLTYQWDLGDGTKILGLEANHCFEGPGFYNIELNLIDTISGFVFLNEASYEMPITDYEQVFIDGPEVGGAGEQIHFNAHKSVVPGCKVKEYYWDFGDGLRNKGLEVSHAYSDPGVYKVRLGAYGESDSLTQPCKSCVFREITILPKEDFLAFQDSMKKKTEAMEAADKNDLKEAIVDSIIKSMKMADPGPREKLEREISRYFAKPPGMTDQDYAQYIDSIRETRLTNLEDNLEPEQLAPKTGVAAMSKTNFDLHLDSLRAIRSLLIRLDPGPGQGPASLQPEKFDLFLDSLRTARLELINAYPDPGHPMRKSGPAAMNDNDFELALDSLRGLKSAILIQSIPPSVPVFSEMNNRSFELYLDSISRARASLLAANPRLRNGKIEDIGNSVRDMKDSTGIRYKIQLIETEDRLNPKSDDRFIALDEKVAELKIKEKYIYTTGDETDPRKLIPTFEQVIRKGFPEALVVAFKSGLPISGNDSTFYLRPEGQDNPFMVQIKGIVIDNKGVPLKASIKWEDLSQGMEIDSIQTNPETGEFVINLPNGRLFGYFAQVKGYYSVSEFVDLRFVKQSDSLPESVKKKEVTMLPVNEILSSSLPIRINNIFFDHNSYKLRPESFPELDRLARILIENQDIFVEIRGHTDSQGDEEDNQILSHNRAKSVVKQLILRGFEIDRIEPVGYGETEPVDTNETEEGRQKNRRVEFRIFRKSK